MMNKNYMMLFLLFVICILIFSVPACGSSSELSEDIDSGTNFECGVCNLGGMSGKSGSGGFAGKGGFSGNKGGSAGIGGNSGTAGSGGVVETGGNSGTSGFGGMFHKGGFAGVAGFSGTHNKGGFAGTGGIIETGGVAGSGGIIEVGGAAGSGGIIETGGASGSGGVIESGGSSGAGGTCCDGGSAGIDSGTGGTTAQCPGECISGSIYNKWFNTGCNSCLSIITCNSSCQWETGNCVIIVECLSGSVESQNCDCGTISRTCSSQCQWGDWNICSPGCVIDSGVTDADIDGSVADVDIDSNGGSGGGADTGCAPQLPVALGMADGFAVLAGATVTNTGFTIINGDLGLSPGSSVTGFPPGLVNGTQHITDPTAAQAIFDLTTAYNTTAGLSTCPIGIAGNLGGLTLYPALYKSTSSLEISSGDLVLDGQGDMNAVFIFQVASSFTMTPGRMVLLVGQAKAINVFWQVGSSATFATTASFVGTIMADQSITFETGAKLEGRALARIAAVTLDSNIISLPAQ